MAAAGAGALDSTNGAGVPVGAAGAAGVPGAGTMALMLDLAGAGDLLGDLLGPTDQDGIGQLATAGAGVMATGITTATDTGEDMHITEAAERIIAETYLMVVQQQIAQQQPIADALLIVDLKLPVA